MKRMLMLLMILTLAAVPALAEPAGGVSFAEGWDTDDNARVFYEIFVGSFSDSDGDGTGDLRGILNRLDYLNDGDPASGKSLGVEGIWLTPVFASPSYHKYDVTDYYSVDPVFGTEEDLRALTEACHARGVKLILDLPINHTGDRCDWYRRFLNAHVMHNTESPYYDFYTWAGSAEEIPAGRHFIRIPRRELWVEANFSDDMPELNFDSPAVREALLDVGRHYLALGVDGFRFDAAKYIYLNDHAACAEFWDWYIGELKAIRPDLYTVAEVWDSDAVTDYYLSAANCFNFNASQVSGIIATTAQGGDANRFTSYVEKTLTRLHALNPEAMNIFFIANHDTDRAAGYLTAASGQMQMAANLYLLSPGSPFIYYGEELGMKGSRGGASTDANRRLAMRWGDGDTVRDPVGATYEASKQTAGTAAEQDADPASLLSHYRRLLMIRRANPEIARGEYRALTLKGSRMGGFTVTWQGRTAAVFHNPTQKPLQVTLADVTDIEFTALAAAVGLGGASLEDGVLTLDPLTSAVLR